MAGVYNLTGSAAIERGACYSYSIDITASSGEFDLTSYTSSGRLWRKWDGESGPNFTAEITAPTSGVINLSLTASQTASLSLDDYKQEIFVYPTGSGCPIRVIEGDVTVVGGSI